MKASEAKEKACPFIQHVMMASSNVEINESQLANKHNHANINCICGDCMAWEWDEKIRYQNGNKEYISDKTDGYCIRLYVD